MTGRWNLQKSAFALSGVFAGLLFFSLGSGDKPLRECAPFPAPVQVRLETEELLPAPPGYEITALDHYSLEALVVSARRYTRGREADLSPLDLVLAWGPLTTQIALDTIEYRQSGRWYFYRWKRSNPPPVDSRAIITNSANTHIILPPDREDLRNFAAIVARGDIVRLSGYLVAVRSDDNWHWRSSRTRTDHGPFSCEVFYVTDASITGTALQGQF